MAKPDFAAAFMTVLSLFGVLPTGTLATSQASPRRGTRPRGKQKRSTSSGGASRSVSRAGAARR
jgi:hypothetical protein